MLSRTVTNVRLGLLHSGEFLLPAYLFELEGGGVQAVPAVEDKYLVQQQPGPRGQPVPAPG